MSKQMLSLVAAAGLSLAAAQGSIAQEAQEYSAPSMEEMAAAMAEAGAVGEMHQMLHRLVGNWNFELTMYMDPTNPMEITGTAETTEIMGGRFVEETVTSSFMGQPFSGRGTTGYNNTTGMFESTWIDNMTTTLYTYTGSMEGDDIVMTGTFKDPMSGEEVEQRSVLTIVDDNHYMVVGYETRGGQEMKTMEIHYMRADSGM